MLTSQFCQKLLKGLLHFKICKHLFDNDIVDSFQSSYKAGHSCETALLRVYNDIVTTVGKGNGAMLVLIDLSEAFDTIDHAIVFDILDKYVGFNGKALDLINLISQIANRVQIDGILSEFGKLSVVFHRGHI